MKSIYSIWKQTDQHDKTIFVKSQNGYIFKNIYIVYAIHPAISTKLHARAKHEAIKSSTNIIKHQRT